MRSYYDADPSVFNEDVAAGFVDRDLFSSDAGKLTSELAASGASLAKALEHTLEHTEALLIKRWPDVASEASLLWKSAELDPSQQDHR